MIREFRPEDWYAIKRSVEPFSCEMPDNVMDYITRGVAVTAEDDAGVIGCGGAVFVEDYCELWLNLDRRVLKHPVRTALCVRDGLNIIRKSIDIPIYARVKKEFDKGTRFVRWLGFRKVSKDKDCLIYRI